MEEIALLIKEVVSEPGTAKAGQTQQLVHRYVGCILAQLNIHNGTVSAANMVVAVSFVQNQLIVIGRTGHIHVGQSSCRQLVGRRLLLELIVDPG